MNDLRQARLNNLEKDIDMVFAQAATKAGLSNTAFDILYALEAYGDNCTQKDLCERCWTGKQTINSSIKKLVDQGIVTKNPGSGRATLITLTDAGRALIAEKIAPIIDAESEAVSTFSNEELNKAIEMMEHYRNALAEAFEAKGLV